MLFQIIYILFFYACCQRGLLGSATPQQLQKATVYYIRYEVVVFIREYGSTLYVGLARAVSPTNTNFRLTFLLTRLQEALYIDLAV